MFQYPIITSSLNSLMKKKCFLFLIREEPNTIIYYSKRVAFCYNLHTLRCFDISLFSLGIVFRPGDVFLPFN